MLNIKYKIIPLTEKNIIKLEEIRFNAYEINTNDFSPQDSFHTNQLKNNKYLVFGVYLNEKLVGACYISNSYNSLYIEQLFILKEYQNTKYHLGTNLLKYVLDNKKVIEDYYSTKLYFSRLENHNESSNLYKNLGYSEDEFRMKKRI